jgi:hypothetical protein
MGDPQVAAIMAAFAVAMTNQLMQQVVDDMRTKAEELLPRDHAAYPVIMAFATQYELHRRDPAQLAELGKTLQMGIRLALAPAPVKLPFRRDLDG